MEIITVTFGENGDPVIDVSGVKGESCREITKGIERALGLDKKTTTLKQEVFQREVENVRTA